MRRSARNIDGLRLLACVAVLGFWAASAEGFPRYNDGCQSCHGEFTDGTSPKGTVFPQNSKHTMHRGSSYMDTECNLCHTTGDGNNPFIGSSDGTANNVGYGCTGCHGHDYGGAVGVSGAGLRAHHFINNVTMCAGCHPNDPAPLPENVSPPYYGTADTNVDDPCNAAPDFLENWSIGDTLGSDNDGDNDYDAADSDCADCPVDLNGDGIVDAVDLAQLLGAWGPNPGHPADFSGDGLVDALDLAQLLGGWGPC